MDCNRCNGLMVLERDGDRRYWRCIQCGEVLDDVIVANRRKSRYPADFVASALLAELTLTLAWKR